MKQPWFRIVDEFGRERLSMMQIKIAVCAHFGVTVSDIISARRTADLIPARQVAMFLSKELTPSTLPAIGRAFGGRDHTTVIYACRKIKLLLASGADAEVTEAIAKVRPQLEAML